MNVGVVGCGRVATLRHLPALAGLPELQPVALADVQDERLEAAARRFGIARRYGDYRELIDDRDVEVVAVCVPASAHAEIAVAALEAGKHVLVEKPLALTNEDARSIGSAASSSPSTATIGFNMRRHRLVRQLRELVRSGALGELQALRTAFTSSFDYRDEANPWRFRRGLGGGSLIEMGAHHLDLWRFVTGREVEEVAASSRSEGADDETVVVTGRLEDGVLATTLISQESANTNEVEIFGAKGSAKVSLYRFDGLRMRARDSFDGDLRHRFAGLVRAAATLPRVALQARKGGDYVGTYADEWRELAAAIRLDRPPETGIEEGVRGVEVMVAALESAGSGTAVPIASERARV